MTEQNRQLRAYCEQNGLKMRSDRVRTYGAVEPKKTLDKSAGSGIIKTEMFRRKTYASRAGVKPIREEVYNGLVSNARRMGANVIRCEYGDEQFLHLEKNGAVASCIGDTLIFRPDATISEVLEELHHFEQNLSGLNDDKDGSLRIILNEIDAKQYLLDNAKRYSIPRSETEETKLQLIRYQQKLEEYAEWGDFMRKIVDSFAVGKNTVLILDDTPPKEWRKTVCICGTEYESGIAYDIPNAIYVRGLGDFNGKIIEFI